MKGVLVNVGLLVSFRNPPQWRIPYPEFYAEQLRQTQVAEELGYDQIWLTEHHFSEDGYSPSLFPLAAAIAARTTSIRIGFYLLLLPLHHPVAVAEGATAIDLLSDGRFDLGVGQGYARGEFAGYGINRAERAGRLEEGITAIRGMWTQDPFSQKGKYFDLADVSITPKPVQSPHPPIWVGAMAPKAVERAARLGCHYLGLGEPENQEIYDGTLRAAGRNPADYSAAQLRWVHVAANQDQAWDDSQEHIHYLLSMYARWLDLADQESDYTGAPRIPAPADLRYADNRLLGSPLIGTPDQVAEGISELTKSCRTTHLVLGMHLPGLEPAKVQRSMELFAKEVMPALR
jgi:alkanesulfonate monooxygenase SsuD/methylene tetrahydromethanopterin reductase-like flavin-dependent oxidoreductase (luciferase family)